MHVSSFYLVCLVVQYTAAPISKMEKEQSHNNTTYLLQSKCYCLWNEPCKKKYLPQLSGQSYFSFL